MKIAILKHRPTWPGNGLNRGSDFISEHIGFFFKLGVWGINCGKVMCIYSLNMHIDKGP